MTRRSRSIAPDYFDALYEKDPDPWQFDSSDYERDKYAATLAALTQDRYESGLEVGCSIGVLTAQLARRCGTLLAIDVAEAALAQARVRCPDVRFERRAVPDEWPDGRFDLIVLSEVLYYLDEAALQATARRAAAAIKPNGTLVLVHYLGGTDYPLTGDQAADGFIASSLLPVSYQAREALYRIDRLEMRKEAILF